MRLSSIALAIALGGGAFAQAPAFEVASVRMVEGSAPPVGFSLTPRRSGGQLNWTTTLAYLVWYAHDVPQWQVSGLKSEPTFYTIAARMNPSATEGEVRAMLLRLLAERLGFEAHTETEERTGFTLVVGRNGHKLAVRTAGGESPSLPGYLAGKSADAFEGRIFTSMEGPGTSAITGRGVPVSKLAAEISNAVGTFVLDGTTLAGDYYFGFRFLHDDALGANARDLNVVSLPIANALEDELGLRLERMRGPVDILVVDRVERIPTEN